MLESIVLTMLLAIFGKFFVDGIIDWYDRWDYQRWLKRRERQNKLQS
jgi:hypothetical protein